MVTLVVHRVSNCTFIVYAWCPVVWVACRTLELLSHLPIERVLLLWLNYHMKIAHKLGANPRGRGVRNLKRDLQDGEVLLTVMQQVRTCAAQAARAPLLLALALRSPWCRDSWRVPVMSRVPCRRWRTRRLPRSRWILWSGPNAL